MKNKKEFTYTSDGQHYYINGACVSAETFNREYEKYEFALQLNRIEKKVDKFIKLYKLPQFPAKVQILPTGKLKVVK